MRRIGTILSGISALGALPWSAPAWGVGCASPSLRTASAASPMSGAAADAEAGAAGSSPGEKLPWVAPCADQVRAASAGEHVPGWARIGRLEVSRARVVYSAGTGSRSFRFEITAVDEGDSSPSYAARGSDPAASTDWSREDNGLRARVTSHLLLRDDDPAPAFVPAAEACLARQRH